MNPSNVLQRELQCPFRIDDPGDGGSIIVDRNRGTCLVTTAAAETRTLPRPTKAGLVTRVQLYVDGGDCTLTVTGGYNEDGDTSITLDDIGDYVEFESIVTSDGSTETFYWQITSQRGTNVAIEDIVADTATITNLSSAVLSAEHGAGLIGTAATPVTYRRTENGIIISDFKIDLTGLASVATANDVIGLAAGGNAYFGQNVVATVGIIYKMELICLETPAGGDDDVNVVVASSGTLAYDGAGGTTYGVNGGDAAAGQVVENLVQGLTANHYFYLTAGTGDTAGTYTAGMFIVRMYGHALLT